MLKGACVKNPNGLCQNFRSENNWRDNHTNQIKTCSENKNINENK